MSEVKLQIIGSILKLDRPFRIPHIMQVTGIDRNLTRYHISALTQQGMLEKIDKSYVVRDKEGLVNSLMTEAEKTQVAKMKVNGFLQKHQVDNNNLMAEAVVAGKVLDLDCMDDIKTAYMRKIDETITEYKNLRKYLASASKSEASAARFYDGLDIDVLEKLHEAYQAIAGELYTPSLKEFKDTVAIAIEDARE